jgi:hypothetical protein
VLSSPRAADFDPVDLEFALLRTAVGDYTSEGAVLLQANAGLWSAQLGAAGLITFETDDDSASPRRPNL